jgi:hypothetical protein
VRYKIQATSRALWALTSPYDPPEEISPAWTATA